MTQFKLLCAVQISVPFPQRQLHGSRDRVLQQEKLRLWREINLGLRLASSKCGQLPRHVTTLWAVDQSFSCAAFKNTL